MKDQIKSLLKKYHDKVIRYGVIAIVVLVALLVFLATGRESEPQLVTDTDEAVAEESEAVVSEAADPETIIVDVAGEVVNPTVVELPAGARIDDAIKAAGGCTEDADLSSINRAAFLSDGEKVYIPKEGEEIVTEPSDTSDDSSGTTSSKININKASSEELQQLNGVGPVTADKIVTYRATYGAFKTPEDIKNVDGIGDKTYAGFADQIEV